LPLTFIRVLVESFRDWAKIMSRLPARTVAAHDETHRRNVGWISNADSPVIIHRSDDPAGYTVPVHSHRHIQLLCVFSGVVLVVTELGCWMIPPGHALLIPDRLDHSVEMMSDVSMRSVYLLPGDSALAERGLEVLEVTELVRGLIIEAIRLRDAGLETRKAQLVLELLVEEVATLAPRPLGLPFPRDTRLSSLCRAFMDAPSAHARLDDWAGRLAMSRRTFTRFFQRETGVSFATWRQQACLFACLPKLADGAPVTQIAMLAGYDNVAAFTTMFTRRLGTPPRAYMRRSMPD
jgi:AraC-like DNA-binding protein